MKGMYMYVCLCGKRETKWEREREKKRINIVYAKNIFLSLGNIIDIAKLILVIWANAQR